MTKWYPCLRPISLAVLITVFTTATVSCACAEKALVPSKALTPILTIPRPIQEDYIERTTEGKRRTTVKLNTNNGNDVSFPSGTTCGQSIDVPGQSTANKQEEYVVASTAKSVEQMIEQSTTVKELNLVLLHGMGGTTCDLQRLSDWILRLLPAYVSQYKRSSPDITIRINTLNRCYPGYVDVEHWAENIAASIHEYFGNKDDLILVGHSMGGKAALYAVAQNVGDLAGRTALVVTINSPIKSLNTYFSPVGPPVPEYCRSTTLGHDEGVCDSVVRYDSAKDGIKVGSTKHWLAFVSSEKAPLSGQFDIGGLDIWPSSMDDGIVPLTAQFSEDADVVYYGEYGHNDFGQLDEPAQYIADQILRYIFGYPVGCSVAAGTGTVEHKADWMLGTDYWSDIVGGIVASTGRLEHKNASFFEWQEWEDVVGCDSEVGERSYAHLQLLSPPILTSIEQSRWVTSDTPEDCRIYLRTRAAPRASVEVDWRIYARPSGVQRAFYDVEVVDSTPLAGIRHISWMNDDPHDFRLWIWSEAQSPFRWFKASWYIYITEMRQKEIIDDIKGKRPGEN